MLRKIYEAIGNFFIFTEEYRAIKRELYLLDNERLIQQDSARKQQEDIISCRKEIETIMQDTKNELYGVMNEIKAETQLAVERKARKTRKQV